MKSYVTQTHTHFYGSSFMCRLKCALDKLSLEENEVSKWNNWVVRYEDSTKQYLQQFSSFGGWFIHSIRNVSNDAFNFPNNVFTLTLPIRLMLSQVDCIKFAKCDYSMKLESKVSNRPDFPCMFVYIERYAMFEQKSNHEWNQYKPRTA